MDKPIELIHQILQKLTGLHRQLLETVRMEREALVELNLKDVEEAAVAKQALIAAIQEAEAERLRHVGSLALLWKRPMKELTLSQIAIAIQGADLKSAEQLRSTYNALTILIQRISEQNHYNQTLLEKSLEHVDSMKKNVLGESNPKAGTYTAQGQKASGPGASRFLSQEA